MLLSLNTSKNSTKVSEGQSIKVLKGQSVEAVIPAGCKRESILFRGPWIPACAGMTKCIIRIALTLWPFDTLTLFLKHCSYFKINPFVAASCIGC